MGYTSGSLRILVLSLSCQALFFLAIAAVFAVIGW
jgi:hypothetical protein